MKKYSILMALNGLDIGGAETHVVELSKELARKGHRIIVASNGGVYEKELEEAGIKHYKVPMARINVSDMKKSYDKVKEIDPRNITRPKNTARKQLVINDEDFKAVIDMYVKEYGEIFREFVEELKVEIIRKISN